MKKSFSSVKALLIKTSVLLGLFSSMNIPVYARSDMSFHQFLVQMRLAALGQGVSENTINQVLPSIKYMPKVIALDRKQSEFTVTFEQYQRNQIVTSRIQKARSFLRDFKSDFDQLEQEYQVPREMVVALWAIESNFGQNMGNFHVPSVLATLAYDGRRADLFTNQFVQSLQIIDAGHIGSLQMRGSWAGAMGQSQFMPSSFLKYAVDATGDGTRDIWNAKKDVWFSIANYLKTEGWQWGKPTYIPVALPHNFTYNETWEKQYHTVADIRKQGIMIPATIPDTEHVKIIKPDRSTQHASFAVFKNFDTILHWNRSYFFALTALKLQQEIAY